MAAPDQFSEAQERSVLHSAKVGALNNIENAHIGATRDFSMRPPAQPRASQPGVAIILYQGFRFTRIAGNASDPQTAWVCRGVNSGLSNSVLRAIERCRTAKPRQYP